MEELVWRKGERCEKSYLNKTPIQTQAPPKQTQIQATYNPPPPTEIGGWGVSPLNKRESASAKMNERYLVGQPIQNPFMPNSNYLNDLEVQMNFLTPQKGSNDFGKN